MGAQRVEGDAGHGHHLRVGLLVGERAQLGLGALLQAREQPVTFSFRATL
jgi:hypothetical protein